MGIRPRSSMDRTPDCGSGGWPFESARGRHYMSYTRKVFYNTAIQIVGKVITTIISLFLVAALTRYLGVSGYGQYTTIFAYIGFFAVFADFGFFWILVREIAHPEADINKAVSNVFTLRTIIGIVIFGLASLIGLFIPQYADFREGIVIIALASLFLALNSTYIGIFQNKHRMDKAVLTDVIGRAIIFVLTIFLISKGYGLNLILWAYAIGNFINLVLSAYLGKIYVHYRPAFDFAYWRKLFWLALPMAAVIILGTIYFKIDSVMLSLMKSSEDIGIYGPPYKVLEILLLFPSIFMGNVFPIVTRYIYSNDERLEQALQKVFDFLALTGLPIVLGVIFTAERIIRIVAGQEFVTAHTIGPVWGLPATSVTVLQILVIGVVLAFFSSMFGYLIIALGKQSKLIVPNIIFVVFNVGLNLILIPKISYIGAAIVTVLTEILVIFFYWWVLHRLLKIKYKLRILWKVAIASLVLGIFLYFWANSFNLIILVFAAVFIYLGVLWILGGVNKQMFLDLLPGRKE